MRAVCTTWGCQHHGVEQNLGARVGGKIGMAFAGAAIGGAAKHPVAVLLSGLIGLYLGHQYDENVAPACPGCGEVLQILDEVM